MMKQTLLALAILAASALSAHAALFYTISDFNHNMDNNNGGGLPELAAGPGVGFDAAAPHDALGTGANNWYTGANTGNYMTGHAGPEHIWFDFGSDVLLNEISVWGYATTNANGIREFDVQFATDAQGGSATLGDETYGSSTAQFTALLDPTPRQSFRFTPINARYARVNAITNYAGQGPPGGDRLGIGEIAFEQGAAPPPPPPPVGTEATIIKPVSVSTSIDGDAGSSHLYLLDDNAGFAAAGLQRPIGTGVTLNTGDPLSDALATVHERSGTAHAESWTRPTGSGQPEFVFDLTGNGDTPVESLLLWQYGNGSPGNSARDFELIFHTEAEGDVFSFGIEANEFTGTMDAAAPYDTAANIAQQFNFASETARYVGLRIANNYLGILSPGGDRYGLGEVRFVAPAAVVAVPEPSTFALAALGFFGLGWYGRRRRLAA